MVTIRGVSAELQHPFKNCTEVRIGERRWFFSYTTCVAYCDATGRAIRIASPSRTTSKHLTQMAVNNFTIVPNELFEEVTAIKEFQ